MRRASPGLLVSHVLVWVYALLLALPLYYLLMSSFKDNTEIFTNAFGLPESWSFENYRLAWEYVSLGQGLTNSLLVTLAAEVLALLVVVPAAYALATNSGRLGRLVERSLALGFLIPGFAALVPTVLLAIWLDLYQTRTFLVLYYVGTSVPLSVVLITQYMRTIPRELEESARLDGANRLQVLGRIYAPLAMPAIATVMLLTFINIWNEYLIALVVAGPSTDVRTAQVALPTLVTNVSAEYGLLTAGTVNTLLPIYAVYLLLRRRMENALVAGAMKG
ncbi:carbohydrate ABC transporter permease [Jiangella alkaliphila]|uniref:ABC-type glycerol-3-phosphate transport system, permease component n=1 Tax=Jiangella alkaliphila TaxID=419479 RepID=A0A1H2L3F7_9ACTN|nr:carbohydrate ABC transporter permease [Jiangella alkaliphila]SDU75439.1 ABC-type glycerol-3-phosphate transport system, permease component [Jiangella alkaliphila]